LRIGLTSLARGFSFRFAAMPAVARAGVARPLTAPIRPTGLIAALGRVVARNILAERERWFPWVVVAFAMGAAGYFGIAAEPSLWTVSAVGAVGLAAAIAGMTSHVLLLRLTLAIVAAACFGFDAAKLRTTFIAAPVIARDTGALRVEGRVEAVLVEDARNARIVLEPTRIGRDATNLPRRIRLSLRGEKAVAAVAPGARVSLLAMIRPPPEPAQPGGYDFARWAFFSGIGGVGFTLGTPQQLAPAPPADWQRAFMEHIERLRLSMSARVRKSLPGPEGAIAAALIAGDRAAISEEDNTAYRDSGLFHVLSISGLHMALAGFGVFWIVRALLALWPRLALTQPIKKWAAVAALIGATFYLFVSGGGAPAVRSFIMLSAMLLAVLVDRPALNMRSVAIAALLILAVEPEGVIEPSFQMSFSAIVGLIALAEWQRSLPKDGARDISVVFRTLRHGRRYVIGLILTSVVAGLATAPFAIYHFDRAPGYSLLANLLATPVVGVVIMPAACFTVVLMPFGLEDTPLQIMGWGVRSMTEIAHWVAGLPGAVRLLPAWSNMVLALIVSGGLWLGLWQRQWRWAGLVPIAVGLFLSFHPSRPDVLITRDGGAVAVRGSDGHFTLMGKIDDYTAEQWLLRDGDARKPEAARGGAACDEWGCVARMADGRGIALALRVGALEDDCVTADVVITNAPLRRSCSAPARVIDRFEILRGGAMALWLEPQSVRAQSVAEIRGLRPWSGLKSGK
jgi:competence protein ComEC